MATGLSVPASACAPQFIEYPVLPAVRFVTKDAQVVTNYSRQLDGETTLSPPKTERLGIDFCNVSLQYGHTGHKETITVQVWLPLEDWNGRMMGAGGGGWNAGLFSLTYNIMMSGLNEDYAVLSTDAGHDESRTDPVTWAIKANGDLNHHAFEDFASSALGDAAIIGKQVIKQFYGRLPEFAYWKGCSTGGRQGFMLSQRYPDAYDGILAAAPAIYWPQFLVAEYYTQLVMNQLGQYPSACELSALTTAAIAFCDSDDGVLDGVISDIDACRFDPNSLIGTEIYCSETGSWARISAAAALVSRALWSGAKTVNGQKLWAGLSHDAGATGPFNLANSRCSPDGVCRGVPFGLAEQWIKVFIAQDLNYDLSAMSHEQFDQIFNKSVSQYDDVIGSNNPDLSGFLSAGGKMISWHGLSDQAIFPNGTRQYYEAVLEKDPAAHDYFRYFEAPGVEHCLGGPGPYPYDAFQALVQWVEHGMPPDELIATSVPDEHGRSYVRPLCPYPLVARYKGTGNPRAKESFYCAETYLSSSPIALVLNTARNTIADFARKVNRPG